VETVRISWQIFCKRGNGEGKMKRKLWIFPISIVLLVLLVPLAFVRAATPVSVYVDPPEVFDHTLVKDTSFNITVKIANIDSPGLAYIGFNLTWAPSLLAAANMTEVMFNEVTPANESSNILAMKHVIDNVTGQAQYYYTWSNISQAIENGYGPILGNHTVAIIAFQVEGIGNCTFHLDVEVLDQNGAPLPQGSSTNDGMFSNIPGDLNGNGIVDIYDAIMLANAFNSQPSSPNWNANADMNNDGIVDIYDAIFLVRRFHEK
jgi:hypothetical protein